MRSHVGLFVVLLIVLILQIPAFSGDLWWDASVYQGMGKYLYSNGQVGLWEESRPIVWPFILGLFWSIGLPVVFLKIVSVLFAVGVVWLSYFIYLELFKNRVGALLCSAVVGLFPVFFDFGAKALSEIPSAFFTLLGVYLILKNKYSLAGLFLGIAIMTRFFQVLVIGGIVLFVIFQFYKKRVKKKEMAYFIVLFLLPIALFLIFNVIKYNDPLLPFKAQLYMTQNTGEIYSEPFFFYFIELLKNNLLILFIILAFFSIKRNEVLLLMVLILSTIPYFFVDHKELRLLLPAIPFLSIFMVKGYTALFKNRLSFIIIFVSIVSLNWYVHYEKEPYEDRLSYFKEHLAKNNVRQAWISSPQMTVEGDVKVSELVYYPRYDSRKIDELTQKLPAAKTILLNSCDLACPREDMQCNGKHSEFIDKLKQSFSMEYRKEGSCEYYVFSRE